MKMSKNYYFRCLISREITEILGGQSIVGHPVEGPEDSGRKEPSTPMENRADCADRNGPRRQKEDQPPGGEQENTPWIKVRSSLPNGGSSGTQSRAGEDQDQSNANVRHSVGHEQLGERFWS